MKLIFLELRKIYNLKQLLFLVVFTLLYTNLFLMTVNHPEDSASCVAQNTLVDILQKEYGYDTTLPYEDFSVLSEIREKQVEKLDKLVQKNPVLQKAGITTYEELTETRSLDTVSDEISNADSEITFGEGKGEVFLKQTIESYYEMMKFSPVMGIEAGKELEAAKTFLRWRSETPWGDSVNSVVAKYMKEDRLSLLPDSAYFHVTQDFPKIGILMIISCMILILPFQTREQLAGVTGQHAATKTGRSIWRKQLLAAVLACVPVCILQILAFFWILKDVGILRYFSFPVSGNGHTYLWYDLTFGAYLILSAILYIAIALGASAVAYLISRMAANYIIGIAAGIPAALVICMTSVFFTRGFLEISRVNTHSVLLPIGFAAALTALAVAAHIKMCSWDKERDITQ